MRVAIIGCGWLGARVATHLSAKGHHVLATATSLGKLEKLKPVAAETHLLTFGNTSDFSFLKGFDAAVFSMPVSRSHWHEGFKALNIKFSKTIFFSSTGIYPQKTGTFTEKDSEELRTDLKLSEELVREKYPETNVLRLAGLMGDDRTLTRFFENRMPSDPDKAANHIHFEDIVQAVDLILNSALQTETINLVAPQHPTLAEISGLKQNFEAKPQRIISGDAFINIFNYNFIHANPQHFSK